MKKIFFIVLLCGFLSIESQAQRDFYKKSETDSRDNKGKATRFDAAGRPLSSSKNIKSTKKVEKKEKIEKKPNPIGFDKKRKKQTNKYTKSRKTRKTGKNCDCPGA